MKFRIMLNINFLNNIYQYIDFIFKSIHLIDTGGFKYNKKFELIGLSYQKTIHPLN